MTTRERKKANWTVGTVITLCLLVWGGGAWAENIKACNERQDAEITLADDKAVAAENKAIYAIEVVTEWRTRALLSEQRIDNLEARVTSLEELEDMVREIHEVVVQ